MSRNTRLLTFVLLLILGRSVRAQETPGVEATLASSFVVVGEQTILNVELAGIRTVGWPTAPKVSPLTLRQYQQANVQRNGRIREVFQYTLSGIRPGVYTIPPFEVTSNIGTSQTKPLTLRVFPAEDLKVNGLSLDSKTVAYLSGVFIEKKSPFIGEPQQVEAKLYVPTGQPHFLGIKLPQFANLEKNGIAAWRFDGMPQPTGVFEREGIAFAVHTYTSSITALQQGELTIGPGNTHPIVQRRVAYRGNFAMKEGDLEFKFPSQSFDVRALPPEAPEGFDGAVGNFSVQSNPLTREIDFGDTITVDVSVAGTGNIDQLPGPTLDDPEKAWKQFEMTAVPQGGERRSTTGVVKFSQVVRPLEKVSALPPYRFVFFDPVLEEYRIVLSEPEPLTVTGEIPVAGETNGPVSLAFLEPSNRRVRDFSKRSATPTWAWQVIPGLAVLALLLRQFIRRLKVRHLDSLPAREFQEELRIIGKTADDRVKFYRDAANFATRWKGGEAFKALYETRDEICFAPDTEPEAVPVPEKNRVLNLLKQLSPLWLVVAFFALAATSVEALEKDPAVARAELLAALEKDPAPEHFYNLALCEEALGNSEQAVLWAYRFEAQGGDAADLLKRLPGIRALDREGTAWVSVLPLSTYRQSLAAAGWAFVLLLLLKQNRFRKILFPILSIILALGLALGITGWILYPQDVSYKPLTRLSVVISKAPLQSQPYEGGHQKRDDISGSVCEVTATRGDWAHLELPGGLSGWVPIAAVESITLWQSVGPSASSTASDSLE